MTITLVDEVLKLALTELFGPLSKDKQEGINHV
jgi:hypothetical protein